MTLPKSVSEATDTGKSIRDHTDEIRKFKLSAKNTRIIMLARLSFSFILTLLAAGICYRYQSVLGTGTTLLLFLMSVTFAAWFGSFRIGLANICLSVILLLLVIPLTSVWDIAALSELILYLLLGMWINLILHIAKKVDLAAQFDEKEKYYRNQIEVLKKDNIYFRQEIKVRDEFLSIASHELKTPLTSTLLKLQTALHNVRNVSLAKFSVQNLMGMLESAELQTKRLSKMINDLLNVSLIRTRRLELEPEKSDLIAIARDVIGRFAEKLEKEAVTVTLKGDESVMLDVDKLRIEQVFTNLISNAIKYGEGKPVEITVKKKGSLALFRITDHGSGIPEGIRKRIFELFERGSNNSGHKGLGIGLYISDQIVRAHRGRIVVESRVGDGSTFTTELPIYEK